MCFYQAHFGRTVLPKMAILGASLLRCILQCFGASEGMLPPGARRSSRASARRIVSCRGLCASSLFPQIPHAPAPTFGGFRNFRERKMRTKFFCTNFLNTARGPGHPGKIPGTSRIPLFETQGRQSFEGGHEVFGHHPFAWKTPTPPGGLRTQKLNLCALFSCLKFGGRCASEVSRGRFGGESRDIRHVPT